MGIDRGRFPEAPAAERHWARRIPPPTSRGRPVLKVLRTRGDVDRLALDAPLLVSGGPNLVAIEGQADMLRTSSIRRN
jgi:hypothetical protein